MPLAIAVSGLVKTFGSTRALWLMSAFAFALVGLVPGAIGVSWAALIMCFVVALLGQLLDLPTWVADLSPFEHVPLARRRRTSPCCRS